MQVGHTKMHGIKCNPLIVLFIAFASILPSLRAHYAEFDEVWRRRADEAWNRTLESYEERPEKIVNNLNMHVHR